MPVSYEKYKIDTNYLGHNFYIIDNDNLIYKCKNCDIKCEIIYINDSKTNKRIINCDNYNNPNSITLSCEEQQIKKILE